MPTEATIMMILERDEMAEIACDATKFLLPLAFTRSIGASHPVTRSTGSRVMLND
jgi:hypothetical protein